MDTDLIEPAERAFMEAKRGFEIFGLPLRGYSLSRKIAAQAMGVEFPLIGDVALEQLDRTGLYAGAFRDTVAALWLMTLRDPSELTRADSVSHEWTPGRATNRPAEAMEVAVKWAESMGVDSVVSEKFAEAFSVFMAIVSGVSASEFRVQVEANANPSEEGQDPKV